MAKYELKQYTTTEGKTPFEEWLDGLRDRIGKAKLAARIRRASFGHFGDCKTIKNAAPGLREMREHYGPGYRIYYAIEDDEIVLLLAGSTKSDQKRAIAKASQRLEDYRERNNDDD